MYTENKGFIDAVADLIRGDVASVEREHGGLAESSIAVSWEQESEIASGFEEMYVGDPAFVIAYDLAKVYMMNEVLKQDFGIEMPDVFTVDVQAMDDVYISFDYAKEQLTKLYEEGRQDND